MYGKNWVHLLYGKSGTGKTTLALSYPKPLLLIDINDRAYMAAETMKDVDIEIINNWTEFNKLIDEVELEDYATVVIDTATGLQTMCAQHMSMNIGKKRHKKEPRVIKYGTLNSQQWMETSAAMQQCLLEWRNIPCNLIINCQEKTIDNRTWGKDESDDDINYSDPEEIEYQIMPNLIPSLVNMYCSQSTLVGRTFITSEQKRVNNKLREETYFCLRIGPHPYIWTNVKKPVGIEIPDYIEDVDYNSIEEVLIPY